MAVPRGGRSKPHTRFDLAAVRCDAVTLSTYSASRYERFWLGRLRIHFAKLFGVSDLAGHVPRYSFYGPSDLGPICT